MPGAARTAVSSPPHSMGWVRPCVAASSGARRWLLANCHKPSPRPAALTLPPECVELHSSLHKQRNNSGSLKSEGIVGFVVYFGFVSGGEVGSAEGLIVFLPPFYDDWSMGRQEPAFAPVQADVGDLQADHFALGIRYRAWATWEAKPWLQLA